MKATILHVNSTMYESLLDRYDASEVGMNAYQILHVEVVVRTSAVIQVLAVALDEH